MNGGQREQGNITWRIFPCSRCMRQEVAPCCVSVSLGR